MTNTHQLDIKKFTVGQMGVNCYIAIDRRTQDAIIIDPGEDADYISNQISSLHLTPRMIVATHGHFDHILGARELQMIYTIPFCIHADDTFLVARMRKTAEYFLGRAVVEMPPQVTRLFEYHEEIIFGTSKMTVLPAPGHTPGGICLYSKKESAIFVGDTIFEGGGVGRTDFSYSSAGKLHESIRMVLSLPDDTTIYSGHGGQTSVLKEKEYHIQ